MTAKKIYEIGEIPSLGEVPEEMYAWVIREDRLGVPENAMQIEKLKGEPSLTSTDVDDAAASCQGIPTKC